MRKFLLVFGLTVTMLMGLTLVPTSEAAFFADEDVVKIVNQFADKLESGKLTEAQIDAEAAKLAKSKAIDGEVYVLMELLEKRKPNDKGGVGIGPKAGAIQPDGLEALLINMKRRIPPVARAGANQKHVIRGLYQLAAVNAIAAHLPVKKAKSGDKLKQWQGYSKDTVKQTITLAKSLKELNDPNKATAAMASAKKAGAAINASCISCHNAFRD